LIDINDIKGYSAINILKGYEGKNPYIKKLKKKLIKFGKITLTTFQSDYIVENHDKEPMLINKIVSITEYIGEELKKQHNLKFVPEKILIEYMLADSDKTFHIYGKLKRNQEKSDMYFIPKTQILDDPYFEEINIEVDFEKYNNVLSLSGKKLYNHQEEGVKFLLSRNGCILAYDMGLGKTMVSIVAALESGAEKILVITPSATKINWEREINIFSDDTTIIDGKIFNKAKFTIINFDILKNFHTIKTESNKENQEIKRDLVDANFDLIIIDEAHYLKNYESIRGKIVSELTKSSGNIKTWLLTGTPIANRPMDFYNLLKIIKSPLTENWKYFATRYCDAKQITTTLRNGFKKKVWLTTGSSNLEELSIKTKNILLRKLKTDVLDMPDKVVVPVYHKLNKTLTKEYNLLWDDYVAKKEMEGKKTSDTQKDLVELILLRKFIAMSAIPHTIEMVENAIEMGRKVIIFTSFSEELETITKHFGKIAVKHNGPMSITKKQDSVDQFQNNDKIKVFVGNIKSAGVGITLTEATVVIFNSFDWVTGNNEQAEDRAFRIGQKNDVNVYYQLFEKTISTKMWSVLKGKREVINTILGGDNLSDDQITEIIINEIIEEDEKKS
jgi:SWI/SNF-related matrix-associated actin-dependent regulator 1 of chromatin subfamily A